MLGCQLLAPRRLGLFYLLHEAIVGPMPLGANPTRGDLRETRKRRPRALGPAFAGEGQDSPSVRRDPRAPTDG